VACAASRLVVVCVADYDATRSILDRPGVADALRGAALVQLSSGGPDDARTLASFAAQRGIDYLDGAIITYPSRIGDEPTLLVYSGSRRAFDAHVQTLRALGGRPVFVSDAVGGAAAVDLAWLSFLYGNAAGLLQGAAFCESERVDPAHLFDAMPSMLVEIAAEAAYYRDLIGRGDYHGDEATLDVHVSAMDHLVATADQNRINGTFPRFLRDLFGTAAAAHGDEEIAAAIEVFRNP
jgi:3-hydroxyisobutyrate dehydrogenase-like beta-hydroxyacid dehydrogenase